MNTPNFEELHLTLKEIQAHPEHHFQESWFLRAQTADQDWCGTKACFAGTTVLRHGWTPVWGVGAIASVQTDVIEREGELRQVRQVASEILGLDHNEASSLFSAYNSVGEISTFIQYLEGEYL